MDTAAVLFFDHTPDALPLYALLEERILSACPDARVLVQKSQITFTARRHFAFASLKGKRLIATFGLPARVDSPRIFNACEPYPNRWTHHVWITSPADVDDELIAWIAEAYAFAQSKGC